MGLVAAAVVALLLVAVLVWIAGFAGHDRSRLAIAPSQAVPTTAGAFAGCLTPVRLTPARLAVSAVGQGASAPVNARLAFTGSLDGQLGVWVAGDGRPGARELAHVTVDDPLPPDAWVRGWSPDGTAVFIRTKLVHHQGQGPDCEDLHVVAADGSTAINLTRSGPDQGALGGRFSPDGRSAAYVHIDKQGTNLSLVDASGTTRVLAPGPPCGRRVWFENVVGEIVWSPDSRRLAVACDQRVVVVSIDTARSTTIALEKPIWVVAATWTPDGSAVLVAAIKPDGTGPLSILSIDPSRGTAKVMSSTVEPDRGSWAPPVMNPGFAPDGRSVLARGPHAIYLVDVASGADRLVVSLPGGVALAVHWLPDSRHFVYVDGAGLMLEADGTGTTTVIGALPAPPDIDARWDASSWWFPG